MKQAFAWLSPLRIMGSLYRDQLTAIDSYGEMKDITENTKLNLRQISRGKDLKLFTRIKPEPNQVGNNDALLM